MKIQEKIDLSYFAGLLDGEGHFCIANCVNGRKEHYTQARIIIDNTDRKMVNWVFYHYGGRITTYKAKPEKNRQEHYRWEIAGKKAIELTLLVRPFLLTKQEQSLKVFQLYKKPIQIFKHPDKFPNFKYN